MKEKQHTPTKNKKFDGLMNARQFKGLYDNGLTLMSAHALQKELALLRAACKPLDRDACPKRPPFEDERYLFLGPLIALLTPEPAPVDTVREQLASLSPKEKWLLSMSLEDAQHSLRTCSQHAPLFLVPAPWNERMSEAVCGILRPAQIRLWMTGRVKRPASYRDK